MIPIDTTSFYTTIQVWRIVKTYYIATMTIEKAQQDLALMKDQARRIRKKMERLRIFLRGEGVDPDPPPDKTAYHNRNKEMYKMYKKGSPFKLVAKKFNLSAARVSSLVRLIDWVLDGKGTPEVRRIYKGLHRYRTLR